MILVNLDTSQTRSISLEFDGSVKGSSAQAWQLSADSITDGNEFEEMSPKVAVREAAIQDFGNGYRLSLPPHSMTALKWTAQ